MSQNAQIEGHVTCSAFKNTIKVFLTSTDTLDNLNTQLNKYFVFRREDHSTSHVFVQQPHYDLGADKEEDIWKTIYYPKLIEDDSDVGFMFRRFFENNVLYLYVRSNCRYVECSREI
jgi:hypothetical protein